MGVASGCGEQEAGGIYGCGCKEVYRFPHITYPYSSCICSFLQQHPYFLLFFLFFVLVRRMPNCVLVRRKKKNAKLGFFYFVRCIRKLRYYSNVIHSFDWKSAVEHDGGV